MRIIDWLLSPKAVEDQSTDELREEVVRFRKDGLKKRARDPRRRDGVMGRWRALVMAGEVDEVIVERPKVRLADPRKTRLKKS